MNLFEIITSAFYHLRGLNNKMTKGDIHLVVNVNHRLHRSFIPDFLWFYPPGPHLVRGAQSF